MTTLLRIWLFLRLVWRYNQAGYRTPPKLAWQLAKIVHQ